MEATELEGAVRWGYQHGNTRRPFNRDDAVMIYHKRRAFYGHADPARQAGCGHQYAIVSAYS